MSGTFLKFVISLKSEAMKIKENTLMELKDLFAVLITRMEKLVANEKKNIIVQPWRNNNRMLEDMKVENIRWQDERDTSELEFLSFKFDDSHVDNMAMLEDIVKKWQVQGVKVTDDNCWDGTNTRTHGVRFTICVDALLDRIKEKNEKK